MYILLKYETTVFILVSLIEIILFYYLYFIDTYLYLLQFDVFRFKTHFAKEVIQETLTKYLKDKEYNQIQAEILSKTIATEVKNRLKGFF